MVDTIVISSENNSQYAAVVCQELVAPDKKGLSPKERLIRLTSKLNDCGGLLDNVYRNVLEAITSMTTWFSADFRE